MEYLQLYLHIIEANNIKGVEKNGNSDPYIRVMVPNAKGKLQELYKTETIKDTRNPKYELELLVRVPCNVDNIVLEMRDYNEWLKDKKLGSVVLWLNKLSTQPQVANHTIDGDGGVLKLCTRLVGSVSGTSELKPVEVLPKTRIHLEHMIYHPGEVVRGYMVFTDREQVDDGASGSVYLTVWAYSNGIYYLSYHQALRTTQGAPRLWAFQFLIPKRIPTARNVTTTRELTLTITPAAKPSPKISTQIIVMPPFEGLEPNVSPRRPKLHSVAPSSLLVTWIDIPKIVYCERRTVFKFTLHNSGPETVELKGMKVEFGHQNIDVKANPKIWPVCMSSREYIGRDQVLHITEPAPLGPSESREFSVVIESDLYTRKPWLEQPSSPFEITGDAQEQNYFLEVVIRPPSGDDIVISRKPFFWTSERLTRTEPPNYQLTMEPDTFWVAPVEDSEVVYPLMAPSAVPPKIFPDCNFQISEPLPTEEFSRLRSEKLVTLSSTSEERPPLTSIFEVPFDDAL